MSSPRINEYCPGNPTKREEVMSKFVQSKSCSWLEDLTTMFWWDVTNKVNDSVEEWLSPDVRIHEADSAESRGCYGRERIIASLNLLVDQLHSVECDMKILKLSTMKKNHGSQTRFQLRGTYANNSSECQLSDGEEQETQLTEQTWPDDIKASGAVETEQDEQFTLGFILEWWCNIIVGIVIERDCAETFCDEVDDTCNSQQGDENFPMVTCYTAFGHAVSPPYLLPRPPQTSATVIITILNCENLVSRLKRPLHQQVCSYVTVSLGNNKQETHVVLKSCNPVFTPLDDNHNKKHHNPMIFVIPDELNNRTHRRSTSQDNQEDSEYFSLNITIEDKRASWADRLGNIRIPLSSLKAVGSSGDVTALRIPFIQRRQHFGIRERTGMKSKDSDVDVIHTSQMDSMRINSDESLVTSETGKTDFSVSPESASYLNVLISKEDVNASWVVSELQARDAARRTQLMNEKSRNFKTPGSSSRSSFEIEPTSLEENERITESRLSFLLFMDSMFK